MWGLPLLQWVDELLTWPRGLRFDISMALGIGVLEFDNAGVSTEQSLGVRSRVSE